MILSAPLLATSCCADLAQNYVVMHVLNGKSGVKCPLPSNVSVVQPKEEKAYSAIAEHERKTNDRLQIGYDKRNCVSYGNNRIKHKHHQIIMFIYTKFDANAFNTFVTCHPFYTQSWTCPLPYTIALSFHYR